MQGIKRAADHLLGTLQRAMKGGGPLGRMHRAYSQSWSIRKVDVGMKGCVMTCDAGVSQGMDRFVRTKI